jgi:Rieske Fe-S protein
MAADRRSFLSRIALFLGVGSSYGAFTAMALRYLYPTRRAPVWRSIFVGRLEQIPDGGTRVVEDLNGVPVQVVRDGTKLRALSTVCPHLGCRVRWEAPKRQFACPCHNAAFDADGKRLTGPAPRDLDRYEVALEGESIYLKMREREKVS